MIPFSRCFRWMMRKAWEKKQKGISKLRQRISKSSEHLSDASPLSITASFLFCLDLSPFFVAVLARGNSLSIHTFFLTLFLSSNERMIHLHKRTWPEPEPNDLPSVAVSHQRRSGELLFGEHFSSQVLIILCPPSKKYNLVSVFSLL
jgi:hypothetical protein